MQVSKRLASGRAIRAAGSFAPASRPPLKSGGVYGSIGKAAVLFAVQAEQGI